ncbi:MFS transporter [Microtetraspora fusca]|uniref:MFS transporter n=1 Tax=Microtetraspora fusca TaxID=1997 RepID=UPI001FDEB262|nr:MFS transporter [Microtetraspora fusca]
MSAPADMTAGATGGPTHLTPRTRNDAADRSWATPATATAGESAPREEAGHPGAPEAPFPVWGLLALFTAAFSAVMTELLPAGLLPRMSADLGVPQSRVGYLVTGYALASFLTAVPVTAALRGLRRRPVLVGALAGFAVCNAVTALSSAYALTFAARMLAGVMGGTMWAMLAGYAARMVPARRRGRAIAVVLAGITVALSLGVPAGTAAAAAFGWRAGFAGLAALPMLLIAWVAAKVPDFPGERATGAAPHRVAAVPGVRAVLAVTLVLLPAHQAMYTYVAPFAARAGVGDAGLVLLVFGVATVAGIWVVGALVDRFLRPALLASLALVAAAMLVLGLAGRTPLVVLVAVAVWGAAFGGAPTLLQTALVDASGPANADVATSLQTTVYNAGIAAGSLAGGVVLEGAGAGALPWTALPLLLAALVIVAAGRRHAFPARRPAHWP